MNSEKQLKIKQAIDNKIEKIRTLIAEFTITYPNVSSIEDIDELPSDIKDLKEFLHSNQQLITAIKKDITKLNHVGGKIYANIS